MVDFFAFGIDIPFNVAALLGLLAVLNRRFGCWGAIVIIVVFIRVLFFRMESVFLGVVLYAPYAESLLPADSLQIVEFVNVPGVGRIDVGDTCESFLKQRFLNHGSIGINVGEQPGVFIAVRTDVKFQFQPIGLFHQFLCKGFGLGPEWLYAQFRMTGFGRIDQQQPNIFLFSFKHNADGVSVYGFDQLYGNPREIEVIGWVGRCIGAGRVRAGLGLG